MIIIVGVIIGLAGLGLLLFGGGYCALFASARIVFDRSLKSAVADSGRQYVETALAGIRNPWIKRILNENVGDAAGAAAVSIVRGSISSRIRQGLVMMLGGLALIISSFNAGSWWPQLWHLLSGQ